MLPRKSSDTVATVATFHTASSVPRKHSRSHSATAYTGHSAHSRTASCVTAASRVPATPLHAAQHSITPEALAARLEELAAAGVRRLPLTRLASSPELARLRPALRAHMSDYMCMAECAAQQYPRAANGKDLALVLRASAVLRSLDDGVSASLPWHMAQMFSVLSPPTAAASMYDLPPPHLHALGLEITPPAPSLGLGLRVEFLSPHQHPTPVPVPADNGDMIAARAAIRAYTSARGVLPTVWDGAYFPWLLTHVLPATASPAEGEAGALASLRVASRLTTRLYAAARRNPRHVPIPAVLSRCYALVAAGPVWTLFAGVLEGDLTVTEIATLNASDPEGLMAALGLVQAIAGEAEARRAAVENWLWCLDPPLSASHSSDSSGSLPVTPQSPASPLPGERGERFEQRFENPRAAPKIPTLPTIQARPFENPRAAPRPAGHAMAKAVGRGSVSAASGASGASGQTTVQAQAAGAPPRPAPRRIPVPVASSASASASASGSGSRSSGSPASPPTSPVPTARRFIPIPGPKSPARSERRMGLAVSPPSPVAVGKGRSAILDVAAWRQAVSGRRPSASAGRSGVGIHRMSKSVG